MQLLLMYVNEGAEFDEGRVRRNVAGMVGTSEARSGPGTNARFEAAYSTAGDSTVVRL